MTLPAPILWERILGRIERHESGCWLWQGATNNGGYGCIGIGQRRSALVHRIAVIASGRHIPDGMTVDHACHDSYVCKGGRDCPHRRCVNPDHLRVMSPADNTSRQWDRDTCREGHGLTERANGIRRCAECAKEYAREWRRARSGAAQIRAWAIANGIEVSRRGALPARVYEAFNATLALAAAVVDAHDRTPDVIDNSCQLVQTRARWVGEEDGEEITILTTDWARALLGKQGKERP